MSSTPRQHGRVTVGTDCTWDTQKKPYGGGVLSYHGNRQPYPGADGGG